LFVFAFLSVIPAGNLLRPYRSAARRDRKQIPCGNDRKKGKCKYKSLGWQLHPTLSSRPERSGVERSAVSHIWRKGRASRNYLDGSSFRMKVNCFLLSKELMVLVLLFSFWYLAQT
jgi:hypothetical protein